MKVGVSTTFRQSCCQSINMPRRQQATASISGISPTASGGLRRAILKMCREGERLNMRLTFLLVTALCIIMLCGGPPRAARAQEYPWCVGGGDGLVDCSYLTYEQCQATASGIGGCFQNPRASMSNQATGSPSSLRPPRTARRVSR
jgi:Protein of unknown function (DUF3551)